MTVTEPSISIAEWIVYAASVGAPVAWLAGYPRSGAALVRTILAHCFGHRTGSIYGEASLGAEYARALNAVPQEIWNNELVELAARQGLLTIKTHEYATGIADVPTIVIVRDGRRVLESLRAFYRERNELEYTMLDLIRGEHYWGDWTAWIRSWACHCRPDTQWLRYEDIMADVPGTVDRIAERWRLAPIAREIPPFESLHAKSPTIFRKSEVEGNGGMTDEEEALFWERHGATMTMMGYHR